MHRIDNSTATTTLPAQKPPGDPGFFTPGSVGGESATIVEADWLNSIQEEICTVISNAGLGLVKGDFTQLWQALLRLTVPAPAVPHGRAVFAGSGTFTVPTGVARIIVRAWGGGGGGGGCSNGGALSAAGGGAEYREGAFAVTPGRGLAVVIGAGGAGGGGGANGGAGGDTTLGDGTGGTLLICKGGGGGGGQGSPGVSTTYGAGGSGGVGGDFPQPGAFGGYGAASASYVLMPGGGGAFCSPPPPANVSSNPAANSLGTGGLFPGAGGSGAWGQTAFQAGAAGHAGLIIIEW
jgi:hypothetical protein